MRLNVDFSDLGLTNHDPLGVSVVCKGIVTSRWQYHGCCAVV